MQIGISLTNFTFCNTMDLTLESIIPLITEKRSAFKLELASLQSAIEIGKLDLKYAKSRLIPLHELFCSFEDLFDQFAVLESKEVLIEWNAELKGLQDQYYEVVSTIHTMKCQKNASNHTQSVIPNNRATINKHLDAILDVSCTDAETTSKGLLNLVNVVKHNLHMLQTLGVNFESDPNHYIIVSIMEKALPTDILNKWIETTKLNEMPTLEEMYAFIDRTVNTLTTLGENFYSEVIDESLKEPPKKLSKNNPVSRLSKEGWDKERASMRSTTNCLYCKKGFHLLYRCSAFKSLSVSQRWVYIDKYNICQNCLTVHKGQCKLSHCRKCHEFHNTLLHNSKHI